MAEFEGIDDDDLFAGFSEHADGVGTDVSGAAGDENGHDVRKDWELGSQRSQRSDSGAGAWFDAAVVSSDAAEERSPFAAWAAVFEEEVGAVFVGGAGTAAGPVVVGDDIAEGDAVFVHEEGGEFGGAFDGGGAVIAAVFAHFDADAVVVAGSVEVCVFALFAGGEVLDGAVFLDGEVPCEEADAVAAGAFTGAEFAVGEGAGVVEGVA